VTGRREAGFFGAKNPVKVPAPGFGEQKIGASVVSFDFWEPKK
jgi:hypothetical protein